MFNGYYLFMCLYVRERERELVVHIHFFSYCGVHVLLAISSIQHIYSKYFP